VLLLLGTASLWAQSIVGWSAAMPLQWSDFAGQPDSPDEIYAAATYAGLEMRVAEVTRSGQVVYRVRAIFDRQRSWVHPHRMDEYVLAHEQLHFDIAEAYARRLEKKLNAMNLKVKDKEVAKKLLQRYNEVQRQDQQRYDKECVHGLNTQKQAEWRQRFDRELRIQRPAMELVQAK
jgi:hypothetical protein